RKFAFSSPKLLEWARGPRGRALRLQLYVHGGQVLLAGGNGTSVLPDQLSTYLQVVIGDTVVASQRERAVPGRSPAFRYVEEFDLRLPQGSRLEVRVMCRAACGSQAQDVEIGRTVVDVADRWDSEFIRSKDEPRPDPADPETPLDRAGLRETRTLWDHASPHGLAVGSLQMWIRAVDPADDEQMKKYCLAGARPDQLWPDCAVQVDPSELRVTLREVSGLSVPSGGMDVVATVAVSAPCYTEAHHRPWSQATDVHFNLDGPLGTAEFNWRAVFDLRSSVADVVLYISLYDRRRGICIGESQLALSHAFVETTVIRDQAEDLVCAELEQLDLCAVDGKRRGHVRCSLVLLSAALAARCPAAPGREKVDVDPCLLEASIGSLKEVPAVLGEHLAQPPRGRRRLDVAASRAASLKRRPRALTGMAALLLPAIVVSALLHHRRSPPASCRAFTSPGPASLPPRRSWTTPFASLAPSLSAPAAPLRVALG
ncbi:unnamed protein product, partial [Prorocentrum cordatum]